MRRLGATVASFFMYLMPVYGLILAALMLGETIEVFHIVGTCLILGGIGLATIKVRRGHRIS